MADILQTTAPQKYGSGRSMHVSITNGVMNWLNRLVIFDEFKSSLNLPVFWQCPCEGVISRCHDPHMFVGLLISQPWMTVCY